MQARYSIMLLETGAALVWPSILALIEPRLKVGHDIPPRPPERMLRIYFMRQRLNLPNPATARLGAEALPSTHNDARPPGRASGQEVRQEQRFWHSGAQGAPMRTVWRMH